MLRIMKMQSAVGVAVFAVFLAGCSNSALAPAGQPTNRAAVHGALHPAWWHQAPDSVRGHVYFSQTNGGGNSTLFGFNAQYRSDHAPTCVKQHLGFVDDIGSDPAGNVYVPNGATGDVGVYAPNCGGQISKIHDPYGGPLGAVVHQGKIFLPTGAGNVAICSLPGCTADLTDPSIFQITSAAVDSSGNVWAAYYNRRGAISLIVWPHAAMPGRVVGGYVNSPTPGGILFDNSGHLVSVTTHFQFVFTYKCDAHAAVCRKSGRFTLKDGSSYGALNAANTQIQITDFRNISVDVYAYPSFAYLYSYDNGFRSGTAVQGITQTP